MVGQTCRFAATTRRSSPTISQTPAPLVVYFINTHTFAAMDFGRRLGASDEHIPQRICKERATPPPAKRHAALRVAPNLARGFVARSVGYRCGYSPPSRFATGQIGRNERMRIYEIDH